MKMKFKILLIFVSLLALALLTSCDKKADCYTTADISYREGVSIGSVAEITKIMAKTPELINEFFADDGSVYITDLDIGEEYEIEGDYNFIAGCFYPRNKEIVMHEEYLTHFYHEFGHYLYHKYSVEEDIEFIETYYAEVEKLIELTGRDYFGTNSEFFAESFYYYIEEKEMLEKALPRTYEYINGLVRVYNS